MANASTMQTRQAPATNGAAAQDSVARQLPGQAALEHCLDALIRDSRPRRASLALLQLANFYEIRTWVGKSEASRLLADIARVLLNCLPAAVSLYRCDNYEFALLLRDECSSNARDITRQVRAALENAVSETIPAQLRLHCVAGLVEITPGLRRAGVALARARHSLGGLDATAAGDINAAAIVAGLRRGQLQLNYQALVSLTGNQQPILEVRSALHTDAGVISGRSLYRAAVINALGEALDRCVLKTCLRLLSLKRLRPFRLLVNLSLNTLVSPHLCGWLEEKLQAIPDQRQRLILQISELDLLIAQHHLAEFNRSLQALALPLSISHFGCSKDPLRYLHLLDVQLVKLDASLTRNLQTDSVRFKALQNLAEKLKEKDIQSTACHVEQLDALPRLWRAGIDWLQGDCLQGPGADIQQPGMLEIQLD